MKAVQKMNIADEKNMEDPSTVDSGIQVHKYNIVYIIINLK